MLAQMNGMYQLSMVEQIQNLTVDFGINAPPNITEKFISMGVDGTIFSIGTGEIRPDIEIPEMPYHEG